MDKKDTDSRKISAAFFDVDYTVLAGNSATLFVKFLRREGRVGIWTLIFTLYHVIRYKLNLLDFERLAEQEVAKVAGESEAEMIETCERWFDEMVVDHIYPRAAELIGEYQDKEVPVVLLSAASVYQVEPLARHLGIEHYLCNRLEVDEKGLFTGKLIKPFCYGEDKILHAEQFARTNSIDLAGSWYYSDSITDLAVLSRFGRPVVVNPDHLLRKEAGRRGWPIVEFKAPPKK